MRPQAWVNDFALLLLDRPSTTRPLLRLPPGEASVGCLPTCGRCAAALRLTCLYQADPIVRRKLSTGLRCRVRPPTVAAVPRPAAAAGTPLTAIGWGRARVDWAPFDPQVLQQVGTHGAVVVGTETSEVS